MNQCGRSGSKTWVTLGIGGKRENRYPGEKRILKRKMERTTRDNIHLFYSLTPVATFYILLFLNSKRIVLVLFITGYICGKVTLWFNVFSKLRIPVKKKIN